VDEPDELASLEVYNTVWPHDALEVSVAGNDPESLSFARRRGLTEERRETGLVLSLAGISPPRIRPPAGIEIVTWAQRPELERGMYEVDLEARRDIPGFEDVAAEPFEDWMVHNMERPSDSPEATFIALAGAEVVGLWPAPRTKAAVSSAAAASRSAQATAAPSLAASTEIARPLPGGGSGSGDGRVPAPTTRIRRPASRPRPGAMPAASAGIVMRSPTSARRPAAAARRTSSAGTR